MSEYFHFFKAQSGITPVVKAFLKGTNPDPKPVARLLVDSIASQLPKSQNILTAKMKTQITEALVKDVSGFSSFINTLADQAEILANHIIEGTSGKIGIADFNISLSAEQLSNIISNLTEVGVSTAVNKALKPEPMPMSEVIAATLLSQTELLLELTAPSKSALASIQCLLGVSAASSAIYVTANMAAGIIGNADNKLKAAAEAGFSLLARSAAISLTEPYVGSVFSQVIGGISYSGSRKLFQWAWAQDWSPETFTQKAIDNATSLFEALTPEAILGKELYATISNESFYQAFGKTSSLSPS